MNHKGTYQHVVVQVLVQPALHLLVFCFTLLQLIQHQDEHILTSTTMKTGTLDLDPEKLIKFNLATHDTLFV